MCKCGNNIAAFYALWTRPQIQTGKHGTRAKSRYTVLQIAVQVVTATEYRCADEANRERRQFTLLQNSMGNNCAISVSYKGAKISTKKITDIKPGPLSKILRCGFSGQRCGDYQR
jgi:hypothetical protein